MNGAARHPFRVISAPSLSGGRIQREQRVSAGGDAGAADHTSPSAIQGTGLCSGKSSNRSSSFPKGLLGGLVATVIMWIAVVAFDYWQLTMMLKKRGVQGPFAVAGG